LTAVGLLVLVADKLRRSIIGTGGNTVGKDLLADEGGHGFLVVLQTWRRVVGRAKTAEAQRILWGVALASDGDEGRGRGKVARTGVRAYRRAGVVVDLTTAERAASVGLTLAPLSFGNISARPLVFIVPPEGLEILHLRVAATVLGSMVELEVVAAAVKVASSATATVDWKSILAALGRVRGLES
jgi:hypothetical protein